MAVHYGRKGIVQQLLSDGRIDVNVGNNKGYTALIVAAHYGQKGMDGCHTLSPTHAHGPADASWDSWAVVAMESMSGMPLPLNPFPSVVGTELHFPHGVRRPGMTGWLT